jgi:hypothetical protein
MKNGALGAQDEKRPRDYCDVDDGMLIPWLNMDREMDTVGSRNGEWKFGKKTYCYNLKLHHTCLHGIRPTHIPSLTKTTEQLF